MTDQWRPTHDQIIQAIDHATGTEPHAHHVTDIIFDVARMLSLRAATADTLFWEAIRTQADRYTILVVINEQPVSVLDLAYLRPASDPRFRDPSISLIFRDADDPDVTLARGRYRAAAVTALRIDEDGHITTTGRPALVEPMPDTTLHYLLTHHTVATILGAHYNPAEETL